MSQNGNGGGQPAPDGELTAAMRGFFELSPRDQVRAATQMRDFLGAAAPVETAADREIRDRNEALEVMAKVATHLGLAEGRAPTANQFDGACRALGIDWNRTRVIRAWGLWRNAGAAFRGESIAVTARQLGYQRRSRGRRSPYEDSITAVRRWLNTSPPATGVRDYDDWAREENNRIAAGGLRVPRSVAVRTRLGLAWSDVLKGARREQELGDLPARIPREHFDWSDGPDDLISIRTVAELLGLGRTAAEGRSRERGFPTSVAVFGRTRAWVRSDVEAFVAGAPVPDRLENELRVRYLDAHELCPLIGLSPSSIQTQRKSSFPPPTGCVASTRYWLRADVERWVEENRWRVARRRQRRMPDAGVETKKLLGRRDLELFLGISHDQVDALVAEPGFPEPTAVVGGARVWARQAVDAYLSGGPPSGEDSDTSDLVDGRQVAALSGLAISTIRSSAASLPPPAGRVSGRRYWRRADIQKWVAERGGPVGR